MKTVKILSLTLLMSIVCATTIFAQQQRNQRQGQRPERTQATAEERAAKQVEEMKTSLNLTPEQVTKVQELQTQHAQQQEQSRTAAKQNMQAQRDAYNAQLKSILTPEQFQKFQEQRQNMRKGDGQRGKFGKQKCAKPQAAQ